MALSSTTHGLFSHARNCCYCEERAKPVRDRDWIVYVRNGNYSAFNGYRWQWSRYSAVQCRACGAMWRTKAAFVAELRDGDLN